jgi:hypothetical protein
MIYRKHGVTERWENGTLIHVTETGLAMETNNLFECRPMPPWGGPPARRAAGSLPAAVADIQRAIPNGVTIERLIVTQGIAEHEYGENQWSEETERVHLSLVRNDVRALIDLGANMLAAGQRPAARQAGGLPHVETIARVAEALTRLDVEREPPARLRLAANVTAALIPSLLAVAPPNVRLVQTAGGVDGKGNAIEEATADWPNWYRPSYRVRPIRMPLNVRLECGVTAIERDRPLAIALLAPVHGLTLRVLVDDGHRAYPATVRVTRIDAVAAERVWYPYGGGSFGAEMML